MASDDADSMEAVYSFVRSVPAGKVVTYGQVAACVTGIALTARQVGGIMRFAPRDVPWQRVVGAGGRLPIVKRSPELKTLQRGLLEAEGVVFYPADPDRVDLPRCQWLTVHSDVAEGSLFDEAD